MPDPYVDASVLADVWMGFVVLLGVVYGGIAALIPGRRRDRP